MLGAMVDVDMSLMPPKVIGSEVCLRVKGGYQRIFNPKGVQTLEGRRSQKK
jgi:hypothetical protein